MNQTTKKANTNAHTANPPTLPDTLTAIPGDDTDALARALYALPATTPPPRAWAMARDYMHGANLQDIATPAHVTRERVRQIIERQSPFSTSDLRNVAAAIRDEEHQKAAADLQAWSMKNTGAPLEVIYETFQIDHATAKDLLGPRYHFHNATPTKTGTVRSTRESLLPALSQFHKETGEVSQPAYKAWADEHGFAGPQTIRMRFGSWSKALAAAGISDACTEHAREKMYTDEDLWAAVVDSVRAGEGAPVTAIETEKWLAARPGMPSLGLIRQRLDGRYSEVRSRALRAVYEGASSDDSWVREVVRPREWASFVA